MSDKTKVVVRIYGQEYTMVGNESREYIQKVANYVDDKMVDIAQSSKKLSTAMVAVLTSLNIADAHFKTQNQLENLEKEAMQPLQELEQLRSQLAGLSGELGKREMEYKETVWRLEEEKKNLSKNDQICDDLRKEMDELKEESNKRKRELEKAKKKNDELQNKLFDSQIKYVQVRKELENYIETFDGEKKKKVL